jgi:hypothetical protein
MSDPLPARTCASIDAGTVRWLWHPFLARGKLSVLDGDPGTGKSFLTVDLAARLSRGGPLPDGQPLDRPHTTLILNAEDDAADTVRPRAAAAGADLSRVVVAECDPLPQFPASGPALGRLVRERAADLLVIDPMMAFFPPEAWANSDQRIRRALAPLAGMAADTGCAVLLVRHLSKATGRNAVYRGSGSVGILGAARTGLLLGRHPDDPGPAGAVDDEDEPRPARAVGRVPDGGCGRRRADRVGRPGRSVGGRAVQRAGVGGGPGRGSGRRSSCGRR